MTTRLSGHGRTSIRSVPAESRLEIDPMISNRDIGFVEVGQDASIKIDTGGARLNPTRTHRAIRVGQVTDNRRARSLGLLLRDEHRGRDGHVFDFPDFGINVVRSICLPFRYLSARRHALIAHRGGDSTDPDVAKVYRRTARDENWRCCSWASKKSRCWSSSTFGLSRNKRGAGLARSPDPVLQRVQNRVVQTPVKKPNGHARQLPLPKPAFKNDRALTNRSG